mmetsp:Transcript_61818/g.121418  ORF Transcript_61818/g.121418 Transcript_61818/m.121418 type:complete len:464 (-) Transcript_61818:121-1512(-)
MAMCTIQLLILSWCINTQWAFLISPKVSQPKLFFSSSRRHASEMRDGDLAAPLPPDYLIKLDSFLKFSDVAQAGGHAKDLIAGGEVSVNGMTETRRGRKLRQGDVVVCGDKEFDVAATLGPDAKLKSPRKPRPPSKVGKKQQPKLQPTIRASGGSTLKQATVKLAEPEVTAPNSAEEGVEFDDELQALISSSEDGEDDDGLLDGGGSFDDYELLDADDVEDEVLGEDDEGYVFEGGSVDEGGPSSSSPAENTRGTGVVANGVTKGGLAVTLRRCKPKDLNTVGTKLQWGESVPDLPSGGANSHQEASNWVLAELTNGFGGIVAVCRAPKCATDNDEIDDESSSGGGGGGGDISSEVSSNSGERVGEVVLSSLVVAPSARQRGVAGALVDYVIATAKPGREIAAGDVDGDDAGDINREVTEEVTPGRNGGAAVFARLPSYKNKAAKKAAIEFFEARGIKILSNF